MKKKKVLSKKIAVTLAAGALFCAGQVFAEEGTQVFQLEQVTVTAERTAQTVGKTPANVTVISGEEIKNKGARTLADALTGVSGVNVRSMGGTGEKSTAYIMGSDRIVVLIDGKRMNLPQGIATGNAGIDLNTILIANNVERIEVVRGGASALYGADAVGGVINIITKKSAKPFEASASIAGGNYGGRLYSISAGGQQKNTRWHLSGVKDSTDGQRPNSDYKIKNISFRLDQELTKEESLTFTYDYYGSRAGMPGSLGWLSPGDTQDTLRHSFSFGYAKEHAAGSRILRYYDNEQTYSGENYANWFRHKNTVRVFEYQDSAKLNNANLMTWGSEWRKDKVTSTAEGNIPRDGTTKAIFMQNQYNVNSASKLILGLRYDNNSIYGTHWLSKVAYLYQASDNTSYFANWGKVFKAPTFDDLYGDDGWGNTGNPNLKPETGWTAELGVKTKINKKNEATLSVFKRSLKDAIKWKPSDLSNMYSPWHPENIDNYQATGVNASLISVLSPAATMDFGYTYLDSHDQKNESLGDPRHSFHVGFNIHSGKWKQTVYGIYNDKNGLSANQVGSRFVVNTNTNYAFNKEFSLFLTVSNLFNKEYQAVNGYPANKRAYLFGVKYSI